MICANGAIIYDCAQDHVRVHQTISPLHSRAILADLRGRSRNILSFHLSDYYCMIEDELVSRWTDLYATPPRYVGDYSDRLQHEITKMEVFLEDGSAWFQPTGDMQWQSSVNVYAGPGYVEIVPRTASKWLALQVLLAQQGIRPDHTAAFGDSDNDLEMLTSVGIGVAMGNAPARIRARVQSVALSNEDHGVACKINEWLEGACR